MNIIIIGACYIRVSTDDQTEYSPDAQLSAIREYAKKNKILIPEEHIFRDDGISGKRADKRPGFQSMISMAKTKPKPFEIILVHKFDRFARSREDSVVYKSLLRKDCNIKVLSITEQMEDDKFSIILESMLEAMAEYYSLNLADEVKKGLFEKARRGENIGKTPYGYRLEGKRLVVDKQEAYAVNLMFETYKSNSQSSLARYLNMHNITTRRGGKWYNDTVQYILSNPVYKGYIRYNYRKGGLKTRENPQEEWIVIKSDHEPIVSEQLFDEVQEKIKIDSCLNPKGSKNFEAKHWLQQILKCSECGSNLSLTTSHAAKDKTYRCGRVRFGLCNTSSTYSLKKTETLIMNQILRDLSEPDNIIVDRIQSNAKVKELTHLNARLKKIEAKQTLARNAYLAQIDTMEEYRNSKAQLQKEENELLEEIEAMIKTQEFIDKSQIQLDSFVALLQDSLLPQAEKNSIAKKFIKEIKFNLKTKEFTIIYYA